MTVLQKLGFPAKTCSLPDSCPAAEKRIHEDIHHLPVMLHALGSTEVEVLGRLIVKRAL